VRNQDVVSDDPGFPSAVTNLGLAAVGGMARREVTAVVRQNRRTPGLVEGDPVLAFRDGLEDGAGIVLKVKRELLLVQETTIPLVKLVGKIPVEESDEGLDASRKKVIDEFDVVVDALLVDGVVATSQRDDSRPGEGKAVAVGAQ
jgi:hypothetical protein